MKAALLSLLLLCGCQSTVKVTPKPVRDRQAIDRALAEIEEATRGVVLK